MLQNGAITPQPKTQYKTTLPLKGSASGTRAFFSLSPHGDCDGLFCKRPSPNADSSQLFGFSLLLLPPNDSGERYLRSQPGCARSEDDFFSGLLTQVYPAMGREATRILEPNGEGAMSGTHAAANLQSA